MKDLFQRLKEYITYQKDKSFTDKQYRQNYHKKMNWATPKTYNEKVQVWKLSREMERLWPYADKLAVRSIVKKKVGAEILTKVYGVWKDASKVNFKNLPKRFVLKPNHASGWYLIVKDKSEIDENNVRNNYLRSWLKTNYYSWYGRERQYKLIKPKIICEEYLEDKNKELKDYKFFCFDGKVHFIQITVDRFINHKRKFYDRNWKSLPFSYGPHPRSEKKFPKPKNLSRMIEIAEKLSSDLKHARIDLYNVDGKIYFGEVTLTPGNGMDLFRSAKYDRIYGSLFKL